MGKIGENQENKDKFVIIPTKVHPATAEAIGMLAAKAGSSPYKLIQLVCDFILRSMSAELNLSDDINKLLTLFHLEPGWKDQFCMADPSVDMEVAQEILILQQPGRKGFGCVMVDKPFMGAWTQTSCVDDIIMRVLEVCMPGIYKRLRKCIALQTDCETISDLLISLTENRITLQMEEENRREMMCDTAYVDYMGRPSKVPWEQRYKSHKHRTPDSLANSKPRNMFDSGDAVEDALGVKPFTEEP